MKSEYAVYMKSEYAVYNQSVLMLAYGISCCCVFLQTPIGQIKHRP